MTEPSTVVTTESGKSTKDDFNIAMLSHLLGIFTGFIGALVLWLLKKDESTFIDEQGKEALNFQITMMLGFLLSALLAIVLIGFFLMLILMILNIIFCIVAAVAASKGEHYKYPFAIRLVK